MTTKSKRAGGGRANWFWLVAALMIVAACALAFSQNAPTDLDSSQVVQFLNQTIDWYRDTTPVQQTATEPDDLMLMGDNGRMANQIVRLSFDFAREEAQRRGKQADASAGKNQGQNQDAGSPALLQL